MCVGGVGWGAGLPTLVLITPCAEPSHHILVGLSLPVVGGGERAKPQYGERVSEYRPHVHPLSFFSPSSLFLFQLLYALKTRDNQTSVGVLLRPSDHSNHKLQIPISVLER